MLLLRRILENIFHVVVSQRSGYPLNNFRTMSMTCHVYIEILETNTEVKTPKLPWWSFNTNGNDHIIIMAVLIKCYLFSIPENLLFMSYILYLSVASIIITDIYKQQKNLHIIGPGLVSFLTNSSGVDAIIRLLLSTEKTKINPEA